MFGALWIIVILALLFFLIVIYGDENNFHIFSFVKWKVKWI
jgi:hypothetical protein